MAQGKLPLDWGMAEHLAFATLLNEGYSIRLSGQDSGRGTFFHRHAVLHDQNREKWDQGTYVPLQHVSDKQGDFVVIDSLLSEEAVMGFEYGYSTSAPNELVIWEAQFGDFANGAQVVIDQFIASGEAKWGRMCGLVLMLPHGYEGQGPEHSSGRIERYMQLCADHNMQVCVPATPVQLYYLLRRQMVRPFRKPLILFTPKSLLRHKESVSPLEEFATDKFKPVNEDWESKDINPEKVKRVVFCSGKVYYDLRAERKAKGLEGPAARAHRPALSVPARGFPGADRALQEGDRDRVVPGRAAQPGRVAPHPALPGAPHAAAPEADLRRARFVGVAGGGLQVAARPAAEGAGGAGAVASARHRAPTASKSRLMADERLLS